MKTTVRVMGRRGISPTRVEVETRGRLFQWTERLGVEQWIGTRGGKRMWDEY